MAQQIKARLRLTKRRPDGSLAEAELVGLIIPKDIVDLYELAAMMVEAEQYGNSGSDYHGRRCFCRSGHHHPSESTGRVRVHLDASIPKQDEAREEVTGG